MGEIYMVYWEPLQNYRTKREAELDIPRYQRTGGYKKASFRVERGDAFGGPWVLYFRETRTFDNAYFERRKKRGGLFGSGLKP